MFGKLFRPNKLDNKIQMDNLLRRAETLYAENNAIGLHDLIKIVLRPVQSKAIREAYIRDDHKAPPSLSSIAGSLGVRCFGYIECLGSDFHDALMEDCLLKDHSFMRQINLASDMVLPTSWNKTSITCNLGKIGEGLSNGKFKHSYNHKVHYSYPLGIGWVIGGNHSIVQGIIRGDGKLEPSYVYDLSPLIKVIRFNGNNWECIKSGENLGTPIYKEFGWVWEIGRLIIELEGGIDKSEFMRELPAA